tara:strand:- start:297 stop:452 length:156 start_codon:yes stop_codon:yes gene_type:complete
MIPESKPLGLFILEPDFIDAVVVEGLVPPTLTLLSFIGPAFFVVFLLFGFP